MTSSGSGVDITLPANRAVARLQVLSAGQPVRTVFVGEIPVIIGRSSRAQISINDTQASRMHAVVWLENGRLWIQDLNSTNGTLLNQNRLEGIESVIEDAILQVGDTQIRLEPTARANPVLWLKELNTGERWPLAAGIHTIGAKESADIQLRGVPDAQLDIRDEQSAYLILGNRRLPLTLRPFRVGVHTLCLGTLAPQQGSTMPKPDDQADIFGAPYRLRARLSGNAPNRIIIEEVGGELRCEIRATNRVALLHTLARQLIIDRDQRLAAGDQGWCRDDEIGSRIWGRQWWNYDNNRLHVLLHRTRREMEAAGFAPGCLQKARGRMRLWIREVELPEESVTRPLED